MNMLNTKKFWAIAFVIVLIAGLITLYIYKKKQNSSGSGMDTSSKPAKGSTKVTNKTQAIAVIKEYKGSSSNINSFDQDFLIAWAKALEAGDPQFVVRGSNYNSKGGKKIV